MAILKIGSKGQEVKDLQSALKYRGYNVGIVDGIFGVKTEEALKSFQSSVSVTPTGELGPWVASKLGLDNKIQTTTPTIKKKLITITAGHNNNDPGAVNGSYKEAFIAVEFRNEVAKRLREAGYTVLTDGEGSKNETLSNAVKLARQADLAIEFHLNAAVNKAAKGVEALSLYKDKLICQKLCKGISEVLDTPIRGSDKGWKSQSSGQHSRLAFCEAGGIILESFFITNDEELQKYFSKRVELFDRITKEIVEYVG